MDVKFYVPIAGIYCRAILGRTSVGMETRFTDINPGPLS